MNLKITRREISYLLCLIMAYLLTINFKKAIPLGNINKELSSIKIEPKALKYITFGNERFLSKLIWIQTLINSDTNRDFHENSWMFYNFKSIKLLDPYFRSNYVFGSLYLSVVKNDLQGASDLYLDGLKVYPNDFYLNYYGAIHFLFEMNNAKTALKFLENIKGHPKSPPYLNSIIARIYAGKNDNQLAFNLIMDLYRKEENELLKEKYRESLYSIKAEIDLSCLNNNSNNCDINDFDGNKYIYFNGKYKAIKEWRNFRINTPKYYKKP